MTKYYDSGYDYEKPLKQMDADAEKLYAHMKTVDGWEERWIALFVDKKSGLFLLDCNAIVASVYQKHEQNHEWYCGHDAGGVASIRTVDGLKKFLEDFKKGEFAGMSAGEVDGYLTKQGHELPEGRYYFTKDEEISLMKENGWSWDESKKRWMRGE